MNTNEQDKRKDQLISWLEQKIPDSHWRIEVASADASFRRYFRVVMPEQTRIAMDAPPDKEDIRPFIKVAKGFKARGVNVPEIYDYDLEQGFMLLQDFGNTAYLSELDAQSADKLYGDALQALLTLQTGGDNDAMLLPAYDATLLMNEMQLFVDWFLVQHLELQLDKTETNILKETFEILKDNALEQPQVWVHRDYHSRNLMLYAQNNPGIIDFQDAVEGAVTYDLVSLLRDCYISWPDEQVYGWVDNYLEQLQARDFCSEVSPAMFRRWFDLMGTQRHLKAIGIFSRLNYRDSKPGYLNDIPRTMEYVSKVSENYPALSGFSTLLHARVIPALQEKHEL